MFIKIHKSLIAGILVILILIVQISVSASTPLSVSAVLTTVVSQVGSSAGDAEENLNSGNVSVTSPDLQLVSDNNIVQLVGMRFTGITIPRNAQVVTAYVEFEAAATDTGATSLTIRGQASENAPAFTTTKNNISARSRTAAQVVWNNIPAWSAVNVKWQTPDLSPVIQEIVNRANWISGNSMVILINGSGRRTAESYDGEHPAAPRLVITYTIPTPTPSTTPSDTRTPTITATPTTTPTPLPAGTILFAVIGDYGDGSQAEQDVANLVKNRNPSFIITTGDNNYPSGAANTIDANIGQYYHGYIHPYTGSYGAGSAVNRFFPSLGNHDWEATNARPYTNYFTLPGNERYYDFVRGPVHFYVVDSDDHEPDGISSTSLQAQWLQARLAASTSTWNLVYMHHPPYSSGADHGSTPSLQWPFQEWGATAVLAGHDHGYERIFRDGIPYFVNGLGGASLYNFGTPVAGSQVRYNGDYGAMFVIVNNAQMIFQFVTRTGVVIDTYTVDRPVTPTPSATFTLTPTSTFTESPTPTATNTFTETPTPTATFIPNGAQTFSSSNIYDGWILESTEISTVGGALNRTATTLRIGDDAANKQYRSILSFDTSALPDNAIIISATLTFKYAGKTGTLPFSTHGKLLVDISNGPYKGNPALQLGDFNAGARNKLLAFTNSSLNNWYSQSLSPASMPYISRIGVTQFRLRFTKDDNNDFGADFLKIYSSEAVEADRPQLIVEYYTP